MAREIRVDAHVDATKGVLLLSTKQVPGFVRRVVLRADLQPGSTGKTAARLAQKFIDLDGVAGTRGDAGHHVWIYSTPDATGAQVSAALAALHAESSVVRVETVR